jgi:hypothetical protein
MTTTLYRTSKGTYKSREELELDEIRAQAQQEIAQINAETAEILAAAQQEEGLLEIFRTDLNGRRLINNEAVRRMIIDLNLGEEDQLGAKWFAAALKNPTVASRFKDSWTRPLTRDEQKLIDESRRNTFHDVMVELGLSECVGNWNMFSKHLDLLDNAYTAKEAITSGAVRGLIQATPAEVAEREAVRIDQHNLRLLASDVHTLKQKVREEAEANRQLEAQARADRDLAIRTEIQGQQGFEPLPDTYKGETVNRAFFLKCSTEVMKYLLKRYGSAQIDQRIRSAA